MSSLALPREAGQWRARVAAAMAGPVAMASHGHFHALPPGGGPSSGMYVEYELPARESGAVPVLLLHGGMQCGANFRSTPDGRPGWSEYFLRRGYPVYVADGPGRGRSGDSAALGAVRRPDRHTTEARFTAPASTMLWREAALHTRWPGAGLSGDPTFEQFFAGQQAGLADAKQYAALGCAALITLLEHIGPVVLVAHSQAAHFVWPAAEARPDLVSAIVAVEPAGPPFVDAVPFGDGSQVTRPWGLSPQAPILEPRAESPADLGPLVAEAPPRPGFVSALLPDGPPRSYVRLAGIPLLVLTGEASYHARYDHCTVRLLEHFGLAPEHLRLEEFGITGNGHMMMLETNNLDIAELIAAWLDLRSPKAADDVRNSAQQNIR